MSDISRAQEMAHTGNVLTSAKRNKQAKEKVFAMIPTNNMVNVNYGNDRQPQTLLSLK